MKQRFAACLLLAACAGENLHTQQPVCRPVDGAWAVAVHVTDVATGRPVTNVVASNMSSVAETDSLGWICMRAFAQPAETLEFSRPGYRDVSLALSGLKGQALTRELKVQRVVRPCCALRGQWSITLQLDELGDRQPKPTARCGWLVRFDPTRFGDVGTR